MKIHESSVKTDKLYILKIARSMTLDLLTISYVAVFNNIAAQLPVFDNQFSRDLFNRPYDTFNGMTPDGYTVALNNAPAPIFVFNPQKLIFKATNQTELGKYVNLVKSKLSDMNFNTAYQAFGINCEYQLSDIGDNAVSWMWKKFIKAEIDNNSLSKECNSLSLSVEIENKERMNIVIEPRAGMPNAVFISVNHHHPRVFKELPTPEEIVNMCNHSMKRIEALVTDKL